MNYVYRVVDRHNVKVGSTVNLGARMRAYHTTNPDAVLVGYYEDNNEDFKILEYTAQRDLRSAGFKRNKGETGESAEWYHATGRMIKYLRKHGLSVLKTFRDTMTMVYWPEVNGFAECYNHPIITEQNYRRISNSGKKAKDD